MTQQFQPSEERIAKVLEKYSPRQIAIAYLRASRRASNSEGEFKALASLDDAHEAVKRGNGKGAMDGLDGALRALRTAKEANE